VFAGWASLKTLLQRLSLFLRVWWLKAMTSR